MNTTGSLISTPPPLESLHAPISPLSLEQQRMNRNSPSVFSGIHWITYDDLPTGSKGAARCSAADDRASRDRRSTIISTERRKGMFFLTRNRFSESIICLPRAQEKQQDTSTSAQRTSQLTAPGVHSHLQLLIPNLPSTSKIPNWVYYFLSELVRWRGCRIS